MEVLPLLLLLLLQVGDSHCHNGMEALVVPEDYDEKMRWTNSPMLELSLRCPWKTNHGFVTPKLLSLPPVDLKEVGKGKPLEEVAKEEVANKETEVMGGVATLLDLGAPLQICHA